MSTKNYAARVTIGGALQSSFKQSFSGASTAIGKLKDEVQKLARTRKDIDAFHKTANNISGLKSKLEAATIEAKKAGDALANAERPTAKLTRAADAAARKVTTLERSIQKEVGTLGSLTLKLNQAGMKTSDLERHNARLERRIKSVTTAMKKREAVQTNFSNAKGMVQSWMGRGLAVAGAAAAFAPAVSASNQFEDMMIDVGKYVDGLGDPDKLKAFGEQIREIGRNSPIGAKGIGELVIGAGKLGMQADEALEFGKAMETMSAGLDMMPDEAAEILTKIKSNLRQTIPEALRLGDAMNFLGDVTASDGKNIADIVMRQGATVKNATSLNDVKVAALASSFDIAAPNQETAATAMKNFIKGLTVGKGATKGNQWAYDQLRLNPVAMAEMMTVDAEKAIDLVLDRLGKVAKKDQGAVLSKLFGEESKGTIVSLIAGQDGLRKSFADVSKEANFLGRSAEEQARNFEKWGVQSDLLKSKLNDLGISIGNITKEGLTPLLKKINPALDKFNEWRKANPKTFTSIVKVAAGAVALTGAIVGVGLAIAAVKVAFAGIATVFAGIGVAITAGVAGPIAAAAAVYTAAALAIRKYWEPIKAFFKGVWQGIKEGWESAGGGKLWEDIKGYFGEAKTAVVDFLEPVKLTPEELKKISEIGLKVGNFLGKTFVFLIEGAIGTVDSFAQVFKGLWFAVEWTFNKISDFIGPWFDGFEAKIKPLTDRLEGFGEAIKKGFNSPTPGYQGGNFIIPGGGGLPKIEAPPTKGRETSQINIQIHSQPGQSEEGIANSVIRRLKELQAQEDRGSLFDTTGHAYG